MNRRILIIVSCALVLSLCVSYLVYRAVAVKASPGRAPQTTPVVVAARDLDAGALIRDIDLKTIAWAGASPKGAISKPDTLKNRGIAAAIFEGEPITENRLAQQGSGGGLAGTIPAGMRACAVKVNEVVGVAGFVVPGMRVDVLVTGQVPGGNPQDGSRVRTLLQNIQVLSAGTHFQRDQESKPERAEVVTLLVTPAQAEILSLASNETKIQLVLRNPMDTEVQRPPGMMVSDLFGGIRASALEKLEPPLPSPQQRSAPSVSRPVSSSPATPNSAVSITTPAPTAASAQPASATETTTPPPSPYVIEELNGSSRTQAKFSPIPAVQR